MTQFEKFLENEKAQVKSCKEFNAPATIEKYCNLIADLYSKIDNEWIKTYIENHDIETGVHERIITEEMLGSYPVYEKWIKIGGKRIMLCPIGTVLIGTDARIDMEYRSKSFMIVHVGENIEGVDDVIQIRVNGKVEKKSKKSDKSVWKVVIRNGRTSYHTLNAEVFQNLLMEIVR